MVNKVKTLMHIEDIVKELRSEENINSRVIIYGFKGIGEAVLEFLMHNYNQIRLSGYSGVVRCFATAEHTYETCEGRKEVKGRPIVHIDNLRKYAKHDLVVVALEENQQAEVVKSLVQHGFLKIVCISQELYTKLRMANQKIVGEIRNEVMQYGLNHQSKLDILREKVKRGHLVKVLFMVQDSTVFGYKSVYWAMERSGLFEPGILIFSRGDKIRENYKEEIQKDFEFFQNRGYRVYSAHEGDYLVDLEAYKPDIIFLDYPNAFATASTTHIRGDLINWKYLTCYVPYGCLMANSFYYHYETLNTREVWKFFLDTKYSYNRCMSEADFNAGNVVLSGYPKFDDFYENKKKLNIPDILVGKKKIVIYAPHWSINTSNRYATFHLYYKYFLELMKNNPEIFFVFKPHPLLRQRIINMEKLELVDMITLNQYEEYINVWDNQHNGMVWLEGDYMDLFQVSTCMITDCGSFIGEYAVSGHPCIYLLNPDKEEPLEGYTEVAIKILDTFYLCNNIDEINETVQNVIIDGKDDKYKEREKITKREFFNLGNAGRFICDYIEKCLKE